MIRKSEKLLITFYTTTAAMAMELVCKQTDADGRLIPVPGTISADCGLAWCAAPRSESDLRKLMAENCITYQGIHLCMI